MPENPRSEGTFDTMWRACMPAMPVPLARLTLGSSNIKIKMSLTAAVNGPALIVMFVAIMLLRGV